MPMYAAQLENGIANTVDKPSGFVNPTPDVARYYRSIQIEFNAFIGIVIILLLFSIIGALYFIIENSIHVTKNGKPKMYFHYWSTVLVTFGSFIYFALSKTIHDSRPLLAILVVLIAVVVYPITLVSLSYCKYKRTSENINIKLFTAPLTPIVPTLLGKFGWQFLMTVFGLYFTGVFICYILYITTNLMLMYYFYPLRTLVRAFYIFGAIFYTVLIGAFVLYQFEKTIEILKLFVYTVFRNCVNVTFPTWNIHHFLARIEEDHNNHKNYYLKKFQKNAVKYGPTGGVLMMIISLMQFTLSAVFLFVYILAAKWFGELLFERTVNIAANIDSLLIILPTAILLILTWIARNTIFDWQAYTNNDTTKKTKVRQSSDCTNADANLGDNEDLTEEEEVLTYRSFCTWLTGGNKRQILKSNYRTTRYFFGRKKRDKEREPLLNPEAGQSRTAQMEFGGQNYGTLAKSSLPEADSDQEQSTSFTNDPPAVQESHGKPRQSKTHRLKPTTKTLQGVESVASGIGGFTQGVVGMTQALAGNNDVANSVGGAVSGVGGAVGGVVKVTKGVRSLTKLFRSSKKSGSKGDNEDDKLSEGVKGAASVVSGAGAVVKGAGGVVSAVAGENETVRQVAQVASGVGGVIDGAGQMASGLVALKPKKNGDQSGSSASDKLEAAGTVVSGAGAVVKGAGGVVSAVAGKNETVHQVAQVASGVGGVMDGAGQMASGFAALKPNKNGDQSGSSASDKLGAAGTVASGAGSAIKGAGNVAGAFGVDNSAFETAGGVASGAGGFFSGIAKMLKGVLGLKSSKEGSGAKEKESQAQAKSESPGAMENDEDTGSELKDDDAFDNRSAAEESVSNTSTASSTDATTAAARGRDDDFETPPERGSDTERAEDEATMEHSAGVGGSEIGGNPPATSASAGELDTASFVATKCAPGAEESAHVDQQESIREESDHAGKEESENQIIVSEGKQGARSDITASDQRGDSVKSKTDVRQSTEESSQVEEAHQHSDEDLREVEQPSAL